MIVISTQISKLLQQKFLKLTGQYKILPPTAQKLEHKTEIHGKVLIDQYFWLRGKEKQEVLDYLHSENVYMKQETQHYKQAEDKIYEEMKSRIEEDDETVFYQQGDYFYNSKTVKGLEYTIHQRYHKSQDESKKQVFLDENELSKEFKYFDMNEYIVSPDGKIAAYSVDVKGDEKYELHFKNLETNEILNEKVECISFSFEWLNNNTVIYSIQDEQQRPCGVKSHKIGHSQDQDVLIYYEDDETREVHVNSSLDGQFIYFSASSYESDEIHFIDLRKSDYKPQVFFKRVRKHQYSISHHDNYFYIVTNKDDSTNFKVMRCLESDHQQEDKWEEIIPHNIDIKIDSFKCFKNFSIIKTRQQGLTKYQVFFGKNDSRNHYIEFPENAYSTWASFNEVFDQQHFRIKYSSLKTPTTVYDYIVNTKELKLLKQQQISNYNPDDFYSERKYIKTRDGKDLPISLVYKKGTQFPANTYVTGYGAYGYSYDCTFNSKALSLLDRGVVYVISHIRGGEDLGKQWYLDGKFLKKKNTFNDFVDTLKYLQQVEKITTPKQTIIQGASAGGLLMGAVVNMAPELINLCIANVPFVDVINTMLDESIPLTVGEFEEWGNPKDKEFFDYMLEYSPYDNVENKQYPNMLVLAGLNDPRVQYWEPAKWVAKLRDQSNYTNKLLLKVNMSGHFGASGRYGYMKEIAFIYTHILKTQNIEI